MKGKRKSRFSVLLSLAFLLPLASISFAGTGTGRVTEGTLNKKIADFQVDGKPLSDALDFFSETTGQNIEVKWDQLDSAGIKKDTPITIRIFNAPYRGILDAILRLASPAGKGRSGGGMFGGGSAQPAGLAWKLEKATIIITTADALLRDRVTETYGGVPRTLEAQTAYKELIGGAMDGIVPGDRIVIEFKRGTEITAARKTHKKIKDFITLYGSRGGTSSRDWQKLISARRKLESAMMKVDYKDKKIEECIQEISRASGVPIFIDYPAVASAGIKPDTTITLATDGKTNLLQTVELILKKFSAGRGGLIPETISDGNVICITTGISPITHIVTVNIPARLNAKFMKKVKDEIQEIQKREYLDDETPPPIPSRKKQNQMKYRYFFNDLKKEVSPASWAPGGRSGFLKECSETRFVCRQTLANLIKVGEKTYVPTVIKKPRPVRVMLKPLADDKKPAPAADDAPKTPNGTEKPTTKTPKKADPEKAASGKLSLAKTYLKSGLKDKAKAIFQEIIAKYPGTIAARTAKEELEALAKE